MPEEIIVASWRDMTVSSAALTRFGPSRSSIFRPDFFSSSAMTFRPWALSSDVTRLLVGAVDLARSAGCRRGRPP